MKKNNKLATILLASSLLLPGIAPLASGVASVSAAPATSIAVDYDEEYVVPVMDQVVRHINAENAAPVAFVKRGDNVKFVAVHDNKWFKVSVDGKEGFVLRGDVTSRKNFDSEDTKIHDLKTTKQSGMEEYYYVAAQTALRTSNAERYRPLKVLNRETRVEYLGTTDNNNGWFKVKLDDGTIGYIDRANVTTKANLDANGGAVEVETTSEASLEGKNLEVVMLSALRTQPGRQYRVIKELPRTTVVKYKGTAAKNTQWLKVELTDGTWGYVDRSHVTKAKEEALAVESVSAINATQVEVKFHKAIDKSTLFSNGKNGSFKANTISMESLDSKNAGALSGELSADGKTLTITTVNVLEKRYDVVVDKLKSTDGKDIIKYEEMITIKKDTTAPTILGVEKITSSTFKVKFSEPMKALGNVSYKLANGSVATTITSDFVGGKQDVVFTLGAGIDAGDVVTATFVGAKDQADNLINPNPTSVTFTKGDKDGVRPEVSSVTPKGLNKFEIKFSEEVQNLLVGNIYVNGTALTGSDQISQDTADKTKYEITLNTALVAGLHKVEVKDTGAPATSVTDLSGEKLKDFSQILDFKADTVAPKFISSAIVVDATTQKEKLVLTFDKEIAQPAAFTTIAATELTKDFVTTTDKLTAGQLTVNANNKKQLEVNLETVKFNTADLQKDATYTVKFPKGYVSGVNTVNVEAFNVTFKRGQDGTVAVDAPTVSSVTATTNDTITVIFDKALDGATATNAANYTIPGLVIENAELSLDSSVAKKVTLTLAKGTNTVNGDRNLTIKNVKAKDGKVMDTVTKLVTDMKENVAPTVTSAKFTGVTGGNVNEITLTFSEAVKAIDVTTDIFEIYVGTSTSAAAVSNVDISGSNTNEIKLTVTTPLTPAKVAEGITVKVKTANKVEDLNGNKLDFTSIKATY